MINRKFFKIIKYKFVRLIEANPIINLLIYNNIKYFKFFLPHEKDYLGMLKVCKNRFDHPIIDIGANLGISTLGFRQMGFKNKIYIFEPNPEIFKKYLVPIKKKLKHIYLYNFALGKKNENRNFFLPFYNNQSIHYFGSFNKKYIINSLKLTFPKLLKKIKLKKKKIPIKKFDDLNLNFKPHFIKIDVEGNDHLVLDGLKKTIKKFKPIFLIEYNKENYREIKKKLYNYKIYIFDIKTNKMIKVNQRIFKNRISRSSKFNLLSNRTIYFIPIK
jgi:FkbM family methyltransferase